MPWLAQEQRFIEKIKLVIFIGRLGNSIALALLTYLTIRNLVIEHIFKQLLIVLVTYFMALSAIVLMSDENLTKILRNKFNAK